MRAHAHFAPGTARAAAWRHPLHAALVALALELELALLELTAKRAEVHLARPCLPEHAAAALFLFDVVTDHLPQHADTRLEVIVVGARALDLVDQAFRTLMLDLGLVVDL